MRYRGRQDHQTAPLSRAFSFNVLIDNNYLIYVFRFLCVTIKTEMKWNCCRSVLLVSMNIFPTLGTNSSPPLDIKHSHIFISSQERCWIHIPYTVRNVIMNFPKTAFCSATQSFEQLPIGFSNLAIFHRSSFSFTLPGIDHLVLRALL